MPDRVWQAMVRQYLGSAVVVHVITQKRIWDAKARWPRAAPALDAWYRLAKAIEPSDFSSLKTTFPAADKVGPFHVFDIGGNKLRLIAIVDYRYGEVFIRHILDHPEYATGKTEGVIP